MHECGHFFTGKILGFSLNRIEIYPYGGCSKFSYDVNTLLWKELLVLIMGPLVQILFVWVISFFSIEVPVYFYQYHIAILLFNLLPILPLDGGKLFQLFFCYFFSYYQSLQTSFYLSYFFFWLLFLLGMQKNLIFVLVFLLLGIKLKKEMKEGDYLFEKFLLERYLHDYFFKKRKMIRHKKQMKRDYYHYFWIHNQVISEKEMLKNEQ